MRLHVESIGEGTSIVALPGGPGFDHVYLRKGPDPLAQGWRLPNSRDECSPAKRRPRP
jgi:hypothetical protein